jgi:hypothetical protein
MTADELFRLPDDGFRHELVRGVLRTFPLRTFEQGALTSMVNGGLHPHVRGHQLGKVAVGVGCVLEEIQTPFLRQIWRS